MAKISIVTRAYNTEAYIGQCVESVLSQTFTDFEYFIINNGSTDKTGSILEEYALKDKRITLIRIPKNDTSISSVQTLIDRGSGEYFAMLDSDDWLEPDFFETLYDNAISCGAQISVGGQILVNIETNIEYTRSFQNKKVISNNQFSEYFPYYHALFRPLWGKLYLAKIVKERWKNIQEHRPVYLYYGGDTYTCIEMLKQTDKIAFVPKGLYHYRVYNKSASYSYYPERFKSDLFLYNQAKGFLDEFGETSEKNLLFLYDVYLNAVIDSLQVILQSNMHIKNKFSEMSNILNHAQTECVIRKLFYRKRFEEIKVLICNLCVEIYEYYGNDKTVFKLIHSIICGINPFLKAYLERRIMKTLLQKRTLFLQLISTKDVLGEIKKHFLLFLQSEEYIKQYFSLCLEIYFENYKNALEMSIIFLNKTKVIYESELIEMILNLAAYIEDDKAFLFAKKKQACYFLKQEEMKKSREILLDLNDMLPQDQEVGQLIDIFNHMCETFDE